MRRMALATVFMVLGLALTACQQEPAEPEVRYVPVPVPADDHDPAPLGPSEEEQLEAFCRDQGAQFPYVDPITGKCTFPTPDAPSEHEQLVEFCQSQGADFPYVDRISGECVFN